MEKGVTEAIGNVSDGRRQYVCGPVVGRYGHRIEGGRGKWIILRSVVVGIEVEIG